MFIICINKSFRYLDKFATKNIFDFFKYHSITVTFSIVNLSNSNKTYATNAAKYNKVITRFKIFNFLIAV